ncbi:glycoside hydrolase family 43 protein [Anaeromicropila populeti]|uniref:Alpha-N-arabinofuranosidase n=1 Tax=Anaeromicropila populeti TaxID=37658 RepID=A0A1I6L660_9FIRM|nr:glycoside hydrolase family 43 protein [Anaeromicropila populeti]SFR98963.1 alpha-N-arabinofuranosidase [Anaeromicropila populeti]
MIYRNPIIAGMHPDPSICRVGEDYFLVNSSFEYFPGIPVFHSRNLIQWDLIGHCITRNSQLTIRKGFPNETGTFAPTIRYHNGTFYVVCTNVTYGGADDGNFFVWTKDPFGEWSDPVWLDCPGIDPSFFFDEDGITYYIGTASGQIYLCQIDLNSGERISEYENIWAGTGGNDPEGPHLYKYNGWYYLLISEGGTEYCHMITVARSKSVKGPYESCPRNPVLTNRSYGLSIKAVGHGDLFFDQNNNWWSVCLGIRPISYPYRHNLGRETMLVPVVWDKDGWPVFGRNGLLDEEIETDRLPLTDDTCEVGLFPDMVLDDFRGVLRKEWNFIYNPIEGAVELGTEGLSLQGNSVSLSEADSLAWIGRRQEHHVFYARTLLYFDPQNEGEEAGLCIYMNNKHHYEIAITWVNGSRILMFRRQIGSLWKVEQQIPYEKMEVEFFLNADKEHYFFGYVKGYERIVLGSGETAYLTTETGGKFTGNYIGLYATGNGRACCNKAVFKWFEYVGK